jgi:hypothetical protein
MDESPYADPKLGGSMRESRHFHSPSELVDAVLCECQGEVETALGYMTADRLRTGHETVRDLIIAAIWMGASPTEMWSDVRCP